MMLYSSACLSSIMPPCDGHFLPIERTCHFTSQVAIWLLRRPLAASVHSSVSPLSPPSLLSTFLPRLTTYPFSLSLGVSVQEILARVDGQLAEPMTNLEDF